MIKFESTKFIENLNLSIHMYNTKERYNYEPKIPLYDEKKGINEKVLKKLNNFLFREQADEMTQEELIQCNRDFSTALKYMELENLDIAFLGKNSKNVAKKLDASFIENLNPTVKAINLICCDLSNVQPEMFSKFNSLEFIDITNSNIPNIEELITKLNKESIKSIASRNIDLSNMNLNVFSYFKNLNMLILNGCNIKNPEFINQLNESCLIDISNNKIDSQYYKAFGNLMENYKLLKADEYEDVRYFLDEKWMMLRQFEHINSILDLSQFDDFEINASAKIDVSNPNLANVINQINNLPNAHLLAVAGNNNYEMLKEKYGLTLPTKMVIEDVSELSYSELAQNDDIKTVKIVDNLQLFCTDESYYTYTREEYLAIRSKIDYILSQLPERPENVSQKQIFTDIYKLIAENIEYDLYAISKDGVKNKELQRTCRNLYGGLVDGKCVCAGYAEILRNVCACAGIEAIYIAGEPDQDKKNAPKNGHAWNCVNLDGQWYNTDITYDREEVVLGKFPLKNFLKSQKDFNHECYNNLSAEGHADVCTKSISDSEQIELFTGEKVSDTELCIDKKQLARNYLSGCALRQSNKPIIFTYIQKFLKSLKEYMSSKDDQNQK